MTYRIKPLDWRETGCAYWQCFAWKPLGLYYVVRYMKNRGWIWLCDQTAAVPCESLEAGKASAEAHWQARISEVLRTSSLDERLETLAAWARMDLPEPYKQMFFDILANGKLAPWGYGEPQEPRS